MAVFSSGGPNGPRNQPPKPTGRDSNLSIVATGMKVNGELDCDGVIKVEGMVEGTVRAARQILVAKDGVIEGDIYTREAIVGGKVIGSVFADERVEVQPNSVVRGDIVTQRLIVQEGGEVNGNVTMGNPKALERLKHEVQEAHAEVKMRPPTAVARATPAPPPASEQ